MATLGEKYLDRARRTVAETLILGEAARGAPGREDLLRRLGAFDSSLDRDLVEDSLDRLIRDARIRETAGLFAATPEGSSEWATARDLLARLASGVASAPLA